MGATENCKAIQLQAALEVLLTQHRVSLQIAEKIHALNKREV